jgi:hypothetical protein
MLVAVAVGVGFLPPEQGVLVVAVMAHELGPHLLFIVQ